MPRYEYIAGRTYRLEGRQGKEELANFVAKITREIRYNDGRESRTVLTIEGENPDGPLPTLETTAEQFATLSWVLPAWGVQAVILPGQGTKDDLRTAIQLNSKPTKEVVYRHTGWATIEGKPAYLHSGGAITADGNNPNIRVELPDELSRYTLPSPNGPPTAAIRSSIALARITPLDVGWTLLAATLAPLYGPVDFAIHLAGRTGTYKSELIALYQAHYGAGMDARHLPGSWSSTANALEAQAYYAKNAAFAVDDFVPMGTSWQQKTYQTTADKIVRSQGNQSGRARLTDTSALQTAMYPRGIILSTGEDVPEGHSVRARMMILELSPGDIKPADLTAAQAQRQIYSQTTAALAQYLAKNPADLTQTADEIRDAAIDIGHSRTPPMLGRLIATIEHVLKWATETKALKKAEAQDAYAQAVEAIRDAADKQDRYLTASDPCEVFVAAVRNALAANTAHVRTLSGGIPKRPTILGWTEESTLSDIPTYKAHGPVIGWADWSEDALYLDANIGYNVARKAAGTELAVTKQTMIKRLKDANLLHRVDDCRQRNTVRITAEGHPRQVLMLSLTATLDTQEIPE